MALQNVSELKGDLRTYPLVELLIEVSQLRLSGSLRISKGQRKSIFYFKNGTVLYAVSNAREHRLFSLLLMQKKVPVEVLKKFNDPANDHDLTSWLKNENILPAADVNFTIIRQMETVIADGFGWSSGEWTFDPLTRAREGMKVAVDIIKLAMEHARAAPAWRVQERFSSDSEVFTPVPHLESKVTLQPPEKYILERFGGQPMRLAQVKQGCPLPEEEVLRAFYSLCLAGLLQRNTSVSAFPGAAVELLKATKYSVASRNVNAAETKPSDISIFTDRRTAAERKPFTQPQDVSGVSDLAAFLTRVEKASDLYETLGVTKSASAEQIKRAYLTNARSFHPDKFHRETPETLRRIHHAFSEIARAHETLKTNGSREAYDLKMKKLADAKQNSRAVNIGENETQAGVDNFELGLQALADDNFGEAATHFSRAVHSCPQSSRFHAYFAKALSAAEEYRHKADAEFQTALKLAPANADIRMMYIDFLIEMDMLKRAEGELTRFLEIAPGNKEAAERLAKLGR